MTGLDGAAPTFEGLAREHPEWQGWLAVMQAALDQAGSADWRTATVTTAHTREPGAPWLAGAVIVLDERLARWWLRRLLHAAGSAHMPGRRGGFDPIRFLHAAIELDADGLEAAGRAAELDADRARALGHPAALPLLAACAARPGAIPDGWDRGYCPVCGAWPAIAELRGLEASRRLRCGRCGADWRAPWLACVYCGNDDHRELGSLVSEPAGVTRRVETCKRCQGYLKSVTTLTARTHAEVVLEDMATVVYDVSALGEGMSRPPRLGSPLRVELRPAGRAGLRGWLR